MAICVCGNEFESSRATAKYCSGACRVKYHRVSVTGDGDLSVTSVTVKPLSVTELSKKGVSVTSDPRGENFGRTDRGRLGHGFDPVGKVYDPPDGKWQGDSFVSKRYKLGKYIPPRAFNRKELERERVTG